MLQHEHKRLHFCEMEFFTFENVNVQTLGWEIDRKCLLSFSWTSGVQNKKEKRKYGGGAVDERSMGMS